MEMIVWSPSGDPAATSSNASPEIEKKFKKSKKKRNKKEEQGMEKESEKPRNKKKKNETTYTNNIKKLRTAERRPSVGGARHGAGREGARRPSVQ